MAIILSDARVAILLIPKCGSKWLRRAVEASGINHCILSPEENGGHHGIDKIGLEFNSIVGVIRGPISWYRSYWSYRQKTGWGNALIDKVAASENFDAFIENVSLRCPAYVSSLYREFLGKGFNSVSMVGSLDSIEEFFIEAMKREGIFIDRRKFPKTINSSASYRVKVSEKSIQIIKEMDRVVYDNFGAKFKW